MINKTPDSNQTPAAEQARRGEEGAEITSLDKMSAMEDSPEMSASTPITTPSKADYTRYKTIHTQVLEDMELIDRSLRRLARNLKTICERRLYFCGGYSTFEDYCQGALGKSRKTVYQLIHAHDVLQHLLEGGIPEAELPGSERLLREIRKLDSDEQVPVWKLVNKLAKQRGKPPTIHDVQAAAVEVTGSDGAIERQQAELIQKFESIDRALKKGIAFDVLTPTYRTRLVAALVGIAETVQSLIAAFRSSAIDERNKKAKNEAEMMKTNSEIIPKGDSYYIVREGVEIARFNTLTQAEAFVQEELRAQEPTEGTSAIPTTSRTRRPKHRG